jgi:hypothetical protein
MNLISPAPPPLPPSVISLRAHANGKYVTAENAGAAPLIANRIAIGGWEQFDVLDAGNGNVALQAHANNQIVSGKYGLGDDDDGPAAEARQSGGDGAHEAVTGLSG